MPTNREVAALDLDQYKYGFRDEVQYLVRSKKGLDEEVVRLISAQKGEPEWMLKHRLKALKHALARPWPTWGGDLSGLRFEDIYFYIRPSERTGRTWDEVPEEIRNTFERLGIPDQERRILAGVGAQYESEVVYHSLKKEWEAQGVIFKGMDDGLREHEELVRQYFGTVVPYRDNLFAAVNTAVWSGGSFVYIPKGVKLDMPLQAYFRINAEAMGQFERTLIIVEEGAQVQYIEGCTAPTYAQDSFHSGVIEILVKEGARVRYTTIQNWSHNVYNLVTQRALVERDGTMEWVDGNLGCLAEGATVTTPTGTKGIEEVEVGEQVLSFDETCGELCFRRVMAKRFSGYQRVRQARAGTRCLLATSNHPFLSPTEEGARTYVALESLREAVVLQEEAEEGMTLLRQQGWGEEREGEGVALQKTVAVVKVRVGELSGLRLPTWDIEVEGTGNFVCEGFIVHNSKLTMKYPSVYLMGEGARGEILSIAYAGPGQHQDAGGKVIHNAPHTSSRIVSKSISRGTGRSSYRGLLQVNPGAHHARSNVECDALLLDEEARTDTYPYIEIQDDHAQIGHEATVSKIGDEQLFYLMSRGLSEDEAATMVVRGFIEPIAKELPLEYAVELNRLIELEMEGSVG